jgi:hypothetical protein
MREKLVVRGVEEAQNVWDRESVPLNVVPLDPAVALLNDL